MPMIALEPIESTALCSVLSQVQSCASGGPAAGPSNATGRVIIEKTEFPLRLPSMAERQAILAALKGIVPPDPTVLPNESAFPSAEAHAASRVLEVEQAKLTGDSLKGALALRGAAFFWWQIIDEIAKAYFAGDHKLAVQKLAAQPIASLGGYPSDIFTYIAPDDVVYNTLGGVPRISWLGMAYQTALHGLANVAQHPGVAGLTATPETGILDQPLVMASESEVASWATDDRGLQQTTKMQASTAPNITFSVLIAPKLAKLGSDADLGALIVGMLSNVVQARDAMVASMGYPPPKNPTPPPGKPPIVLKPGVILPPTTPPKTPTLPAPPKPLPDTPVKPMPQKPAPTPAEEPGMSRGTKILATVGVVGALTLAAVAGAAMLLGGSKSEPEPEAT